MHDYQGCQGPHAATTARGLSARWQAFRNPPTECVRTWRKQWPILQSANSTSQDAQMGEAGNCVPLLDLPLSANFAP